MEKHCMSFHLLRPAKNRPSRVLMILPIFFTTVLCTGEASVSDNTIFRFDKFFQGMPEILLEGDASVEEDAVQLTSNLIPIRNNGSVGRATYSQAVHLWDKGSRNVADFNTTFSFEIKSNLSTPKGYGMTFFLAPNDSKIPHSSGGENLALYSAAENPDFVAVEFDTYPDKWDPEDLGDHIGIDISSLDSAAVCNWTFSDTPHGTRISTSITYNSTAETLSVVVKNDDENGKPHDCILQARVDFTDRLPEWVRVGFSASTSETNFENHEIYYWEFSSFLPLPENPTSGQTSSSGRRKNEYLIWVIPTISALALVPGLVWLFCWINRRQRRGRNASADDELENDTRPRSFSYDELAGATNNFAEAGIVGRGGSGIVYQGFLRNRNSSVAVKRITSDSEQGFKEYAAEVKTISQLRHRNLVQLIGWCQKEQELLIVYEFMPNRSLDFHLYTKTYLLTWETRYKIALGLASALFYLQEECDQCVLHRDIKSSNVLLDSSFNAKLGDFGLARLVEHGQSSGTTTLLVGSKGYIAPEYLESLKASTESDIYSFGIVALEIACGKPAVFEFEKNGVISRKLLVAWVWEHYGAGNLLAAADPRLGQNYIDEEVTRLLIVGLSCAHPNHCCRPSIGEAIEMLKGNAHLPSLPVEMPEPPNIVTDLGTVSAFYKYPSTGGSGSGKGQSQFSGSRSNFPPATTGSVH